MHVKFKNNILSADEIASILKAEFPECHLEYNIQFIHKSNASSGKMEKTENKQILLIKNDDVGLRIDVDEVIVHAKEYIPKGSVFKAIFGKGNSERKVFKETVLRSLLKHI